MTEKAKKQRNRTIRQLPSVKVLLPIQKYSKLTCLRLPLIVCRLVSMELERQLDKTAKSGAVIGTGHRLDSKGNWESNKRIKYKNS